MMYRIVGCLLLVTTVTFGQRMQIRGGLNFSGLLGASVPYTMGPGFYIGIAKDYKLGRERVTFQPGAFYSLQCFKNNAYKYRLQYLQVPMMLNIKVGPKTGLLLGPQLGLMARATAVDVSKNDKFGATPWFNLVALSAAFGVSTSVNDNMNLDLRTSFNVFNPGEIELSAIGLNVQIGMSYFIGKNGEEK